MLVDIKIEVFLFNDQMEWDEWTSIIHWSLRDQVKIFSADLLVCLYRSNRHSKQEFKLYSSTDGILSIYVTWKTSWSLHQRNLRLIPQWI